MRIREIRPDDGLFFAKYARAEDVAECLSVSKEPLAEHILKTYKYCEESYCFVDDKDRPLALYGIIKDKGYYFTWLLTTVFIEDHKLSFMKEVRKTVKKWYKKYGTLFVVTDLRYKRAIKLNEWAGFKRVGDSISINGTDFGIYRFSSEK